MSWHLNAVFYELYLRAFADGDDDGHGDFTGLRDKLDYLEWLGVDCIWLLPIYPSPLKDDGYDIASYYGIHPDYGLLEDFKMALDEIHRRGMRLIVDLVINHTSDQHPWFKEARRSKHSPVRDYYVWSETPDKYKQARIIFIDTEESNWAYDEGSGEYFWHRFYSSQPDLNFDNPMVRDEILNIMKFWLDLGVDGFRADAVPYLFEREGTSCENLAETHDYLKEMRRFIDQNYPNAVLLAEANQWAKDLRPYFGDGDEFHMCFHFPVMPRLYQALAQQDRTSVVEVLNDTPAIPDNTQWGTFLRNHDELTLEMVTPEIRQFMWEYYSPDPDQRINLGIRRRLAPLMGNDRRKVEVMHSMLFTLPGTPVLYYGDEIGMGDDISLFDRNGVRTPMQWDDSPNAGFSTASDVYAPAITSVDFDYRKVNVASQRADDSSLLNTIRTMIAIRKTQHALIKGQLFWLDELPKPALCFWRSSEQQRLLVLHSLSNQPLDIPLPVNCTFTDLFQPETTVNGGEIVTLSPYGYRWFGVK